ncbi:N-acetylmuramoyl-L-alanine amidase [Corynebacterium propinquum]|uniref:N-acetylmuramoyl-L-alanine amidase n=1 Tax=Corynebacterium propinquum TaxID=43769 RepID=UPI001EF388BB|nr:N-acetylmuramoyl-L-alanine amidase [Corynebacterium propinquum]MCG7231996.1 N-acetylmuramoyl-L-alanine amidase [Corynebacterium propinquum]WKS44596.1 N-acetylmuramoyl-L-alanine amidase [Corynebacterium propinquum]
MRMRRHLSPSRPRWITPTIALTSTSALVLAAAFGDNQVLNTQGVGHNSVEATLKTTSFSSGTTTVVDDPAIATQGAHDHGHGHEHGHDDLSEGESRAVQEFTQDEEFDSFALTWEGDRDVLAFFRAQAADGSWGPWLETHPLPNPDEASKQGTELIYVAPTNKVQVSLAGVDLYDGHDDHHSHDEHDGHNDQGREISPQVSTPKAGLETSEGIIQPVTDSVDLTHTDNAVGVAPLPKAEELSAVFVNGQEGATPAGIQQTANLAVGMPSVVTRQAWGANESFRGNCGPTGMDYKAMTLHHTAGVNNYSRESAAAQVRGAYQYHTQSLGWCDIGYHALVDKFGTIYEGRRDGLNAGILGAHAGGYNTGTFGIAMIGNHQIAPVPQPTINSVGQIAGWRAAQSGFDPSGTVSLTSEGSQYARYPAGDTRTFNRFHGHRDVDNTECPGDEAVKQWAAIRAATNQAYSQVKNMIAGNPGSTPGQTQNNQSQSNQSQGTTPHRPSSPSGNGAPGQNLATLAATAIGLIAPIVMRLLKNSQTSSLPDNANNLAQVEVIPGLKLGDVPGLIGRVVQLTGDSTIEQTWARINALLGPVLGTPITGIGTAGVGAGFGTDVDFAVFDNGVIVDSEETGTQALWGEIARVWANGAVETLGLPTSTPENYDGNTPIQVNFQHGSITYDPSTGHIEIVEDD